MPYHNTNFQDLRKLCLVVCLASHRGNSLANISLFISFLASQGRAANGLHHLLQCQQAVFPSFSIYSSALPAVNVFHSLHKHRHGLFLPVKTAAYSFYTILLALSVPSLPWKGIVIFPSIFFKCFTQHERNFTNNIRFSLTLLCRHILRVV